MNENKHFYCVYLHFLPVDTPIEMIHKTFGLMVWHSSVRDGLPGFLYVFSTLVDCRWWKVPAPQLMLLHLKSTLKNADLICFNWENYIINNCQNECVMPNYSCMSSIVFINWRYDLHPPTLLDSQPLNLLTWGNSYHPVMIFTLTFTLYPSSLPCIGRRRDGVKRQLQSTELEKTQVTL